MGKIFYIFGKSSTGKDTIYKNLMENKELGLRPVVPYTTRPMRAKETPGVEYHFTDEEELSRLHRDSSQDQAFLYYYDALLTENLEEQRDLLKKSYEADPELFDTRVLLANAERGLGNLADAHAYLEEAVSKESQDAGALRGLAVLAMLEEEGTAVMADAADKKELNFSDWRPLALSYSDGYLKKVDRGLNFAGKRR